MSMIFDTLPLVTCVSLKSDTCSLQVLSIVLVAGEFAKRGVKVLALSSDDSESHRR